MPVTVFSFFVLILLLIPGVIFVIQLDSRRPYQDLSSLRELVTISAVGALCDLVTFVLFGIFHAVFPGLTPNIGAIVRNGSRYVRFHYVDDVWWTVGLLVTSCVLAYCLGRFWPRATGVVESGKVKSTNAWWELFHMHPDTRIHVGCELQDGSYISGYLLRYSTEADDTSDRELSLADPVMYRFAGTSEIRQLEHVGAVSVKASEMKYMAVTYQDVQPVPDPSASVPATKRSSGWSWVRSKLKQRARRWP